MTEVQSANSDSLPEVSNGSLRKREFILSAVVGVITAFFLHLLLSNNLGSSCLSSSGYLCNRLVIDRAYGAIFINLWLLYIIIPILEAGGYLLASKLFSKILILKQAGRFAIVGFMNFNVDAGILTTLSRMTGIFGGTGIIFLNAISVLIALINSYYWNHFWTFKAKSKPSRSEFITFLVVSAIGIGINSGIVFLITTFVPPFDGITNERLVTAAKIAATAVALFWNFLGYKFIVFKSAPKQAAV